jgi:hypothetical protein
LGGIRAAIEQEGQMRRSSVYTAFVLVSILGAVVLPGWAQQMSSHAAQGRMGALPTLPGQDAFGAIQEIVRILEADPATDWSKVNLERLRQHLIDMNEVALRAAVTSVVVPGGLSMEVTGAGRTEQAIRDMVGPHTNELNPMKGWSATAEAIPGGIRLVVTAEDPTDTKTVARIRGLGFIGLLVQGAHHQPHHLAMARGEAMPGHGH